MRKFNLLFSFFLILFFFNSCDNSDYEKEKKIYGTWETNGVMSEEDDQSIIYSGKVEFYKDNERPLSQDYPNTKLKSVAKKLMIYDQLFRSRGKYEIRSYMRSLVFNFIESGSWKLEDNYLIKTTQSVKLLPDNYQTNKFTIGNPNFMEDFYSHAEGLSISYEIITLNDDFMRIKDTDIENDDPFENYTRVKKVLKEEYNSTEKNIQEEKPNNKSKEEKVSAKEKKARELELCKSLQEFQIEKYGSARADCEGRTKEEAYRIYVQQNR